MKRAYLRSIVTTMAVIAVFVAPLYGQKQQSGSYVIQNFTLSDFGDGYDAAKKLVWKPKFSDYAVQAEEEGGQNDQAAGDDQAAQGGEENTPQPIGGNPDPERNAVRYAQNKPTGITDLVAGSQKFVLGVKAAFTQQGYNWIEIYPHRATEEGDDQENAGGDQAAAGDDQAVQGGDAEGGNEDDQFRGEDSPILLIQTDGEVENAPDLNTETEPFRIPFAGKATELSVWVWGGHYGWWVEAYLRDYVGVQYRLPLGDLLYTGWRQKRTGIPDSVIQGRKRLPATQTLSFEMLKLWSFPTEKVNNVYVYFDLLQHNGVVSTDDFNGKDLETLLW